MNNTPTTPDSNRATAPVLPLVMRTDEAARFVGLKRTSFLKAAREGAFTRVALVGAQTGFTVESLRAWAESRPVIAPRGAKTAGKEAA